LAIYILPSKYGLDNYFLIDTSALAKRYVPEIGTALINLSDPCKELFYDSPFSKADKGRFLNEK